MQMIFFTPLSAKPGLGGPVAGFHLNYFKDIEYFVQGAM